MGFDLDARWVIRAARAGAKGQVHKKNFLTVKAIRKPCAGAPMVVVGNPPFSATNAVTTRKRGSRGSLRSGEFLFMAKAVALGADYVAFLMAANMKRDTAQARVHPNLWLVKQLDLGTVTFNPSAPKAQQTKLRCVFQVWQRRAAPRPKMKQWNVRRWNAHTRAPFEMLVLNDRRVNLMVGNFRKPGEVIVEKRSIAASLARGRKATYQRAGDGMMYHLHVVPARRAAVLKFLRAPATQAAFYTNARNTKRQHVGALSMTTLLTRAAKQFRMQITD
jgi:hypothetical protein